MRRIPITEELLTGEARIVRQAGTEAVEARKPDAEVVGADVRGAEDVCLRLGREGAGLDVTWLGDVPERYLVFWLEAETEHSVPLWLQVYSKREESGEAVFDIRFGVLPGVRTGICLDLNWLDAHVLFPETCPGQLKLVCHGRRVEREEIERIELVTLPLDADIRMRWSDLCLTEEYPEAQIPVDGSGLPDACLVDELGQSRRKEWGSKLHGVEELRRMLLAQEQEVTDGYPFADWSAYGGWKKKRLTEGSGFFSRKKEDGRWWLVDPEGYAFFSMGPDCVVARSDCRIDGVEKWMEWLPDREDPAYGAMYREQAGWPQGDVRRRTCTLFSFEQANLYRAFGEDWYGKWKRMIPGQLRKYGMNTLGNWSDEKLLGTTGTPYVTSLPHFPGTEQTIFRDFPDVFSEEYRRNARKSARALEARKDDPLMIGYFLRNEPAWAFVDHLVLADEVLYNPAQTACRRELIRTLAKKYGEIGRLNDAWNSSFASFEDLKGSLAHVSERTEASCRDMHEFSRRMMEEYVGVPARACREVDQNHMILGMRWAWISDPDVICGWENFDVFSINCYSFDPTPAIQNVVELGVDLPVMIGEFHFGALDAGPTSTGLEGVAGQRDRGIAYRRYVERVASHPHGVGCHYFQCYDQFVLGRFDGENYNIGLFDICSQPYPEMMQAVRACSAGIYEVAAGEKEPTQERARETAMIAF